MPTIEYYHTQKIGHSVPTLLSLSLCIKNASVIEQAEYTYFGHLLAVLADPQNPKLPVPI